MKYFPFFFFFYLFVNMDLNWYVMISKVVNICFHCISGTKLSNFVYVPGHIEHILFEVFKVGKLKMLKINVFHCLSTRRTFFKNHEMFCEF